MNQSELFPEPEKPRSRAGIVPRDYQITDHDETFRLWDAGTVGVLTRGFTGCGKSLMTCLKADTWLQRGDDYRVMILSYEEELVKQFAKEVVDYIGIDPQIEMGSDTLTDPKFVPKVTVATRQSLALRPPPTEEQKAQLLEYGLDPGCIPKEKVKSIIKALQRHDINPEVAREEIARLNAMPEAARGGWSRVHKYDWHYNWMICFDEAHKHAHHLKQVGHIVDWFDQNPISRRTGMTATPKRADGVSIGNKMFPGISLDLPLFKPGQPCGVLDGYAVPYKQRYIEVAGVDFKTLGKIGNDFDEGQLERELGNEKTLATLVNPLLDMVEDRSTLIFSPTVQMAKDVASYINARSRTVCTCGTVKWYPTLLIGDGATCECGRVVDPFDVDRANQARELDGGTADRDPIYKGHKTGDFQFLSICGLCREGYNDRNIGCVAIFRPVSKEASALAEQMKGRGSRPLEGVVDGGKSKEERLAAIAASEKNHCLIVDLVGITGLPDCVSTVEIYAEGLPDTIIQRARDILTSKGVDEAADVEGAIEQAKREDADAKKKAREERERAEQHARELAERRAKAGAETEYTTHEVGYGAQATASSPNDASEAQLHYIGFLGMELHNVALTKKQAGRIINQIQAGMPIEDVAYHNGIEEGHWEPKGPTFKQVMALKGIPHDWVKSGADASALISARKNVPEFESRMLEEIHKANSPERLTNIGQTLVNVNRSISLPGAVYGRIVAAGKAKRSGAVTTPPPDDF